jgi:hypothetical protein
MEAPCSQVCGVKQTMGSGVLLTICQPSSRMRRLAKQFGLFVGPSSGAHLVAARTLKQDHDDTEHVVTFFCDEGEKYINDYFLT